MHLVIGVSIKVVKNNEMKNLSRKEMEGRSQGLVPGVDIEGGLIEYPDLFPIGQGLVLSEKLLIDWVATKITWALGEQGCEPPETISIGLIKVNKT